MPQRLPRPDALIVEQEKLTRYLLNAQHPDGISKARFFEGLGFGADTWSVLKAALIAHGREREIVQEIGTGYGTKYIVRCSLGTPDHRNPCINSVWIKDGERPPRLVTAYPHRLT